MFILRTGTKQVAETNQNPYASTPWAADMQEEAVGCQQSFSQVAPASPLLDRLAALVLAVLTRPPLHTDHEPCAKQVMRSNIKSGF